GLGLNSGTYTGNIIINSNDPNSPQSIPVTFTIDGAPIMDISANCLDLDTALVGATNTAALWFYNTGCDTLFVTSITNALPAFASDTNKMAVLPYDSLQLTAMFTPASTGLFQDTFIITTNDFNTTVCLTAYAIPAPALSINPDFFNDTITSCCDSITFPLTINNTGGSNLFTTLEFCNMGIAPLSAVLTSLNANNLNVVNAIPNRFDFDDGITGDSIWDGGGDMYDRGNFLGTNFGEFIHYSDNVIAASTLLGSAGQYFTRKYTGLFVFAADLDAVDFFEITGNLGADGSGNMDATILSTSDTCGITYKGFVKRVYGTGDPSVNHLIIVRDTPGLSHTYSTDTEDDQHRVSGLNTQPTTRLYHLLYASASGGYIDDAQTLNIMNQFITSIAAPPAWVNLSSITDTTVAGDSSIINVEFISCGNNTGTYTSMLLVSSNDPANPVDTVDLTLTIIGNPTITLSDTCLDFDTIMEFTTAVDSFQITNTGCDTLFISDANNALAEFTLSDTTGTLAPGQSTYVVVSFAPLNSGNYNDAVTIFNNDINTTICFIGVALESPTLTTNTNSFNVTINSCCDSTTLPFTIHNTGAADLTVDVTSSGLVGNSIFYDGFESG
ncbi:MAG TPA: choice-of-anchor D domain-containing protein, partial [Flavobacteriales bacterium]|nr:choice-of-anchor D domain-containing protein [Flavobacteriales bacterium]